MLVFVPLLHSSRRLVVHFRLSFTLLPLASVRTRLRTIPLRPPVAGRHTSMASASSSVAGPSSIAFSAAALPSASGIENGSTSEGAAQPAASVAEVEEAGAAAASNGGHDQEMSTDAPEDIAGQHTVEEDAYLAAPSTASTSTATVAATTATSLPTPSTTEPPLSAPAAPPPSSDGRRAQRAAKLKASAMVSLGSEGLEGSLSASEGPATPIVPNTAPLSRAKRQRNVKFR